MSSILLVLVCTLTTKLDVMLSSGIHLCKLDISQCTSQQLKLQLIDYQLFAHRLPS